MGESVSGEEFGDWDDDGHDDEPPYDEPESWDGFGYWDPEPEDDAVDYGPDAEFLDAWCSSCRDTTGHVITERGEGGGGSWADVRCTGCWRASRQAVEVREKQVRAGDEEDGDLPF